LTKVKKMLRVDRGYRRVHLVTVGLLILVVGLSHWITPVTHHRLHIVHVILRKLFVLPIVLAAIWFELSGAIVAAAIVSLVYVPHVFVQWGGQTAENINQLGEVATIWVLAVVSGIFARIEKSALRDVVATHEGSLIALVAALDAREHHTELHSLRVKEYALRIGHELGVGSEEMHVLGQASLLHDVGKIGTPDSILLKPGPLDDEEWRIMRQHPETGQRLLLSVPFLRDAAEIVRCHHERWDGSGYPRGLRGEQIPLLSRIFAVADVFDALTCDRPYRTAMSCEEAQEEIRKESGTLLDPGVVDAFLGVTCSEWNQLADSVVDHVPVSQATVRAA